LLELHPRPVSLVISDVQMPNLGGLDLTKWLRHWRPAVKVLLMSGDCGDDMIKEQLGRDDVPFLAKPFRLSELALMVTGLLL
jgi:two-component system response regulator YesN